MPWEPAGIFITAIPPADDQDAGAPDMVRLHLVVWWGLRPKIPA